MIKKERGFIFLSYTWILDCRLFKLLLHRIIVSHMEEEQGLIHVQEGTHRSKCVIYIVGGFITISFAVAGILFIDYVFAKKIWI